MNAADVQDPNPAPEQTVTESETQTEAALATPAPASPEGPEPAGEQAAAKAANPAPKRRRRPKVHALPARLGVAQAAALHGELQSARKGRGAVTLDGSAVEQAGAAAYQLLTTFAGELEAKKRALKWKDPSPALCEGARLLGLDERLGLVAATPGAKA